MRLVNHLLGKLSLKKLYFTATYEIKTTLKLAVNQQ